MRQLIDIPAGFDVLCAEGKTGALATVIAVEGSAYRRPGARMLIAEDGRTWGGVSGGCLERDVAHRGRGVIVTGTCVTHRYDTIDDEGLSLGAATGCGGSVDVFIQPVSPHNPGPIAAMRDAVVSRQTQTIATVIRTKGKTPHEPGACIAPSSTPVLRYSEGPDPSDDPRSDPGLRNTSDTGVGACSRIERTATDDGWTDLFIERITPPQSLIIFGAGPDVVPLVAIAKTLGWHTTIVGAYPSTHLHDRFATADARHVTPGDDPTRDVPIPPDAAVCLMTHNLARDALILSALPDDLPYVGLLGPRHRTDRVMLEVKRNRAIGNLHNPIGLDVGAETSEEIALAIAAEIQAMARRRPGVPLSQRSGPIHDALATPAEPEPVEPTSPCPQ